MRWRVERAGVGPRYFPGWIARTIPDDRGEWFPTHPEAIRFVDQQIAGCR